MLTGKDFRGCHECPLIAALRHSPQGTKGQRRLTAAYIPLHQAAHGSFTAQVLKNFLQYPLLRMRWWKRKRLPIAGRRTLFQGHGKAFFPPLPHQADSGLIQQHSLESQSPSRHAQVFHARGKVRLPDSEIHFA